MCRFLLKQIHKFITKALHSQRKDVEENIDMKGYLDTVDDATKHEAMLHSTPVAIKNKDIKQSLPSLKVTKGQERRWCQTLFATLTICGVLMPP